MSAKKCLSCAYAALLVSVLTAVSSSAMAEIRNVQRDAAGVSIQLDNTLIRLDACSPSVLRIRVVHGTKLPDQRSLSVIGACTAPNWTMASTNSSLAVRLGKLTAHVDTRTGSIAFVDARDQVLLQESGMLRAMVPAAQPDRDGLSMTSVFTRKPNERFFGLGVVGEELNAPSATIKMVNMNAQLRIPFLYSSSGYGLLWDNPAQGSVTLTKNDIAWNSDAGDFIDYYVMAGPRADDVIASYRSLTGEVPLFPSWAYGLVYSRARFKSQNEILTAVQNLRQHRFAVDAVFQDFFYWAPTDMKGFSDNWGSHIFAEDRYPDPQGLIDTLHQEHVRFLPVIWPKLNETTDNGRELDRAGGLFPARNDWSGPEMRFYDPFGGAGGQIYASQITQRLLSMKVDGFWVDGTEPEMDPAAYRALTSAAGPVSRLANAYPLAHTSVISAAMRNAEPDKRVFVVPRSAWAGEQRNGTLVWTGDINQSWADLRWQVVGLQNFSMTGIPYITTDVGGSVPTPDNDAEHFVRWSQWGIFAPIYRIHGGDRAYPWQYGSDAEAMLRNLDDVRHQLFPYIYSAAANVTFSSGTIMRPLVMDFRNDPVAVATTDEFLFGSSLLVAPITRSRFVELPLDVSAWHDQNGDPGRISVVVSASDLAKSVLLPNSLDLSAKLINLVEKDPATATFSGSELVNPVTLRFSGSFVPTQTGKFFLRFVTRKSASEVIIAGKTYTQQSDYQFLTVPIDARRGEAIDYTLTTADAAPAFRVLRDEFPSGAVARKIYLPPTANWYDFWSGKRVSSGGSTVRVPLSEIPVYVRAGSVIPMAKTALSVDEMDKSQLELRVYRGANGVFRLYQDFGDGYGYTEGQRTWTSIRWNETERRLSISARNGTFPNMLAQQSMHIVWIDGNHPPRETDVVYTGAPLNVRAP